jgi:hypothetical protein
MTFMMNPYDLDVQRAVEKCERDMTDDLIEVLVLNRHCGMTRDEALSILIDVFAAPWSRPAGKRDSND